MHQRSAFICPVLTSALLGCAPVQKAPPPEAPPSAEQVPPTPRKPAPPTTYEISPEQKRDMYLGCWSFFNSRKLEKIIDCYHEDATFEVVGSQCPVATGPAAYLQRLSDFLLAVPDAKAKLQLTLTFENTVVGVALIRGTNTGPLKTPDGEIAATKKTVGFLFGHVVDFKQNRIARDRWFRDPNTMLSQIGKSSIKGRKAITESADEKPTPIGEGSNQEKMNVGLFNNYFAAFNTHDLDRVEPMLTDDYVYSNQFAAKDYEGKAQAMKYHEKMLEAFSDMKIEHDDVFGAGDFVVGFSTFTGTNDGPLRAWGLWKGTDRPVTLRGLDILRIVDSKVQKHLYFADGSALAMQLGVLPAPESDATCPKSDQPPAAGAEEPEKDAEEVESLDAPKPDQGAPKPAPEK